MTTDTAKQSRRVRFTLPETGNVPSSKQSITPTSTKSKAVHGTQRYVNGTLVTGGTKNTVIVNRNATNASPVLKTYGSDTNVSRMSVVEKNILPKIDEPRLKPTKKAFHAISATVKLQRPRTGSVSNISRSQSFSVKKVTRQSSSTKPSNKRYSDSFLYASKPTKGTPMIRIDDTDQRTELELPKFEHALDPHLLNLPNMTEDPNANYLPHLHESIEANSCLKELDRLALSREKNLTAFWDFVEKWRTGINANKFEEHNNSTTTAAVQATSNRRATLSKADSAASTIQSTSRLKAFKMNLEKVPLVTELLRASRDADEILLKDVFRQILEVGITNEDLNITDKSGRTALSYICSSGLTKFLELILQLPDIDVNKPDNEGNTPLHFAAQAGQNDAVNLLITKSRSLVVDAKNNLGFTPLMKAALQGRTRCAKLLLFAGASPVEVDLGRGLRADQWARFVGRHTCAEMIEQYSRARLMDRNTPSKWSHDTIERGSLRKTIPAQMDHSHTQGFYSKFLKALPFKFAREKNRYDTSSSSNNNNNNNSNNNLYAKEEQLSSYNNNEMVSYLGTTALICSVGVAVPTGGKVSRKTRVTEVPKVEITYANNQALIEKYERIYGSDTNINDSSIMTHREGTDRGVVVVSRQKGSPLPSPAKPPSYKVKNRK